jgi:hypothetical protein
LQIVAVRHPAGLDTPLGASVLDRLCNHNQLTSSTLQIFFTDTGSARDIQVKMISRVSPSVYLFLFQGLVEVFMEHGQNSHPDHSIMSPQRL